AWRPRVVWVGAHSSRLVELKKRVEQGIQQAGFHPERVEDFKAHVTLARVKGDHEKAGKFVREHAEDTFGNFEARSVLLKQSILTPSGSEYQIIRKVDL
ncbi:MAG TPA: RNA 2',3'-cyclic phosphodiesterase, partial [archaeon]|nr:RNA 2',3'-cyclic phosphodiesterase [archaeon]